MKHIIFIEGVSGVGKSTAVKNLFEQLQVRGFSGKAHYEGDADSPLDLCWTAYLSPSEYRAMLSQYSEFQTALSHNTLHGGAYYLVRYRIDRIPLYSEALDRYLHSKEFCYNPENILPLSVFTEVFCDLWTGYMQNGETLDYEIFDASLVSHMTNDLMRNYHAAPEDLARHLSALLEIIRPRNPIIFYLYTDDVSKRVTDARRSRSQPLLSPKQIQFWEDRMCMDLRVLSNLNTDVHFIDVSSGDWSRVIPEILSNLL